MGWGGREEKKRSRGEEESQEDQMRRKEEDEKRDERTRLRIEQNKTIGVGVRGGAEEGLWGGGDSRKRGRRGRNVGRLQQLPVSNQWGQSQGG